LLTNISELHLLKYKQKMLKYLQYAQYYCVSLFEVALLEAFSELSAPDCSADMPISNDLMTDVYLEFSECTQQIESESSPYYFRHTAEEIPSHEQHWMHESRVWE
jgi:hypothetical protein